MDMIAEAAGVSKPVLYQHFESKQELYLALIDSSASHLDTAVQTALASATEPEEQIRATYSAYFNFVITHREEFVVLLNSDVYEPQAQARVRALRERSASHIVEALQRFTDLNDQDARLLCRTLIGTAEVVVKQVDSSGDLNIDETVDLLTQLSWGGLKSFSRD